jgi:serine protease Do
MEHAGSVCRSTAMHRAFARIMVAFLLLACLASPGLADYGSAKSRFAKMNGEQQTAVTLALIATGDFDGLVDFGFTRRLYNAIRRFERREGLRADGVLDRDELRLLARTAEAFYGELGSKYYAHPSGFSRLLVPRRLFDREQKVADGIVFTRDDRHLSLDYVAVPRAEKSFASLFASMTRSTAARDVSYARLFKNHFVVTGKFKGRKFYSWFNRYPKATVGFTVSWSESWDSTGRKVSSFLANSFLPN